MKIPCAFCKSNATETGQVDLPEGTYLIPACDVHRDVAIEMRTALEEGGSYSGYPVEKFLKIVESDLEVPEASPSTSWVFSDHVGHWNLPDGNEVKIEKMSKDDFAQAVWAIIKANFQRRSAALAWAGKLVTSENPYVRLNLKVGLKKAKEKLEDFEEIAERKKWV
jgi:hypothetical protein